MQLSSEKWHCDDCSSASPKLRSGFQGIVAYMWLILLLWSTSVDWVPSPSIILPQSSCMMSHWPILEVSRHRASQIFYALKSQARWVWEILRRINILHTVRWTWQHIMLKHQVEDIQIIYSNQLNPATTHLSGSVALWTQEHAGATRTTRGVLPVKSDAVPPLGLSGYSTSIL